MKKIFMLICLFSVSSCMRLGDYNAFGFRDVIVDFDSYEITPADNRYRLIREEEVTEEFVKAGEQHRAFAGDTVYYIKIYNVKHYERPILKANKDGTLKGLGSPLKIDSAKAYESLGTVDIDGISYALMPAEGKDLILVDKDGNIYHSIGIKLSENGSRMSLLDYRFRLYPKDLKIEPSFENKKEVGEPFYGIEIVYKGKTENGYRLAYRDFFGNGAGEFQNVDFTQDYEFVDFGNLKLKIVTVTPDSLEYIVLK